MKRTETKKVSMARTAGVAVSGVVAAVGLAILILFYLGHLGWKPCAYLGMVLGVVGALGLMVLTIAKAADEDGRP